MSSSREGKRTAALSGAVAAAPTVRDLAAEALRLARVDLPQAEAVAVAACDAAAALDDPVARGYGWRALANVRYLSSRCEEAVELYSRALDAFESGADPLEAAKTRSSALQALILLGRYQDAERWAAHARETFAGRGEPLLLARLDCNVGNLLHRLDRHREALDAYETSLRFFRAHPVDPQATAAALLNSAVCLTILGELGPALERFEEMSAHCREHDMPLPALQAEYNVAYLRYHRGEYSRAIELYRDAIERSREQGDAYHQALCRLDLAEIHLELNLVAEAGQLAEEARAAFSSLETRYEAAKACAFAAIAASRRGELERAGTLFAEAAGGFDAEGNLAWRSMVDLHRAIVLLEERRPAEARREATRARHWFAGAGQTPRLVLAELLLARAELALGALPEARRQVESARRRLEGLDSPHLQYRALFVDGQVAEAGGDRAGALERYAAACDVLGGLRRHLHGEDLLIAFVRDKDEVHESLVTLLLEDLNDAGRVEQAFGRVESAKSRAFAELIAPRLLAPRGARGQGSSLDHQAHELREELNWCYSQLDAAELEPAASPASAPAGGALLGRGVSGAGRDDLRRRSQRLERKLVRITSRQRSRDLDLDAHHAGECVSLESIRAALPADAVLVEYYEARGTVYAFVLGRDRLEVRPVTTSERVRRLLGFLRFQLSKLQLGDAYVATFAEPLLLAARSHLGDLHRELIAPVRRWLEGRSLVVVPHGPLHGVPFHALWDGDAYLIDDFAVSYAPSASIFELCSTQPRRPSAGALVLAVPDANNPGIAAEAGVVAGALPGAQVRLGDQATAAALREHGPAARLVHIAAHGFFRRDHPMFSAIQLGASRLTVFDLYQLDLAAEVFVLSGCGTGLSVVEGGDELIGLVRGLLYAGARTVVATLWDAQDESTQRFMEAFYRRLPGASDRAAALREAMLELRRAYPHPFHWAPFFAAGAASGPALVELPPSSAPAPPSQDARGRGSALL